MQQLVGQLRERLADAREGGGPKYLERPASKARCRSASGSTRCSIRGRPSRALAAGGLGHYDNEAPGAGIVTASAASRDVKL